MSLCALCGLTVGDEGVCPHHVAAYGDDWAAGNRVMCDFVHRRVIGPARQVWAWVEVDGEIVEQHPGIEYIDG